MIMVSVIGGESFLSLEPITSNPMSVEEERDYYRQRFQNMKLVFRELQQQVAQYKTQCSGVSTVALMLKESKQEVMKVTRQRKALETAVANLQNRLSTNGLSSSVNIEETEIFIPGASKQTMDNLVKENARLRSLLKSHEGQAEKRSSEDILSLKTLRENLESENNQLRAQLSELESMKMTIASQYDDTIKKIMEGHEIEKLQLKQELSQYLEGKRPGSKQAEASGVERRAQSTQTLEAEPSKIPELRVALKLLSEQCLALDQNLENVQEMAEDMKEQESFITEKANMVREEVFREVELKLSQVIQMNQHWQAYNKSQEQQIHALLARISELEQISQEGDTLRSIIEAKENENENLRKDIAILNREVNKFRSQPQYDMSIVEILKQQIQVCTEDFNTERKDREHAVNKVKQLQDEISKLTNENETLEKKMSNLQKIRNTPEVQQNKPESELWLRQQPYKARGGPVPLQRGPLPYTSLVGTSGASGPSISTSPMSYGTPLSTAERSLYQPSMVGYQGPYTGIRWQPGIGTDHSSLPRTSRGSQESSPAVSQALKPAASTTSLPTLSRKSEGPSESKQPDLICPKCGKEFTETQQAELITHINTCTD